MADRPRRQTFLPFSRPTIGEEEIAEVADTLRSGWVTTGPKSARFEEALKAFNEVPYCLALMNATTGLEMTLGALGIGPGDEVITTAHTFVCTVSNVVLRGAVPILVDIEPDTMNLDAERIEERITPRTKAILPVHYGGLPCRMERIWKIAREARPRRDRGRRPHDGGALRGPPHRLEPALGLLRLQLPPEQEPDDDRRGRCRLPRPAPRAPT